MTTAAVARHVLRVLGAAAVVISALLLLPGGDAGASTEGCPDVEVVFARGTAEPPGLGWIGQQFTDALRWRVGGRQLAVYPVNFPALPDFATTVDGVIDAGNHIRDTAAACPDTQMVLGGYSRGAALIGYVIAPTVAPGSVLSPDVVGLPPEVAGHVSAVALLGKSSNEFLGSIGAPPVVVDPGFAARTIDLCAPGDPICSAGHDDAAHATYVANGMTVQAADFAADHLLPPEARPDLPV